MMCIASMKNMTDAHRALRALSGAGVSAEIVGLDPNMTKHGCAYGVSFACKAKEEARRLLASRRINYGELLGG